MSTQPPSAPSAPADEAILVRGFRLVLIASALFIAGCSAFFSVRGLGLLFVGSEIEVMIMASSLEIGKLVAASFLYRYWDRINRTLRFYLTVAVVALVAITSLGNYGYLARAYEKTTTNIARAENEIAALEKEIAQTQTQIAESRGKNQRVTTTTREDVTKAQARLAQATEALGQSLARLQQQRQNLAERRTLEVGSPAQRAAQRADVLAKSIAAEEAANIKALAAEENTIAGLNERLRGLDQAVDAYVKQGSKTVFIFERDGVRLGQQLREEQRPERESIRAEITAATARMERLRTASEARVERLRAEQGRLSEASTKELTQLRGAFDADLARIDAEEKAVRKSGGEQVAALERQLAVLQEQSQGKVTLTDTELGDLYRQVRERQAQINGLRDQIAGSDIGSYRFVARAFEAEADDVVKWLMLALVAVFDPLAVTLVIAFNMAVQGRRPRPAPGGPDADDGDETPGPRPARRGAWSAGELTVVGILIGAVILLVVWALASDAAPRPARVGGATMLSVPADSFAVVTLRPDEFPQKSGQGLPQWLESAGGKGLGLAVGELLRHGLDPRADLYAFAKFPARQAADTSTQNPVILCGAVLRVTDPVAAEAGLSRIADQMNGLLRNDGPSKLTRNRSMIRHGEGRYMDPEGGFFTFGLTNQTAIILLEFDGNPRSPCVEEEIRRCLSRPEARVVAAGDAAVRLPAQALGQAGALTVWLDSARLFGRLPMGEASRNRYEKLRPTLDFELLLSLRPAGRDGLTLDARYAYQAERFADGKARDLPVLVAEKAPANPDFGWKLINRSLDTLDFDAMIDRMREALGDDRTAGAPLVHVEKSVVNAQQARFTMRAKFDAKAGPPLVAAWQRLAR